MAARTAGRPNQKRRTRKALLEAAARLTKRGARPSLEQIAEEALVSRATAYRYFPAVEPLLLEAAIDMDVPAPEALFGGTASDDPVARLEKVDATLQDVFLANEASLRLTVAASLRQAAAGDIPARQNRRSALIEAALEPARRQFTTASRDRLVKALALLIGTEGMIAIRDVLQLDVAEARRVKRWALRALVEAARRRRAEP